MRSSNYSRVCYPDANVLTGLQLLTSEPVQSSLTAGPRPHFATVTGHTIRQSIHQAFRFDCPKNFTSPHPFSQSQVSGACTVLSSLDNHRPARAKAGSCHLCVVALPIITVAVFQTVPFHDGLRAVPSSLSWAASARAAHARWIP